MVKLPWATPLRSGAFWSFEMLFVPLSTVRLLSCFSVLPPRPHSTYSVQAVDTSGWQRIIPLISLLSEVLWIESSAL